MPNMIIINLQLGINQIKEADIDLTSSLLLTMANDITHISSIYLLNILRY